MTVFLFQGQGVLDWESPISLRAITRRAAGYFTRVAASGRDKPFFLIWMFVGVKQISSPQGTNRS